MGFHHVRNSRDYEEGDLLFTEQFRQEIPAELAKIFPKNQTPPKAVQVETQVQEFKTFEFQVGSLPRLASPSLSGANKRFR